MILGLFKSDEDQRAHGGFLYVGSHNFTPAAWGRLSSTNLGTKLSITNHELGVIQKLDYLYDVEAQANSLVTWKRPTTPYRPDDKPWVRFLPRKGVSMFAPFPLT
jgi:tyrosyl-DNA phosphodiesterase-1